jgi:hypothetical protein
MTILRPFLEFGVNMDYISDELRVNKLISESVKYQIL